ncbi:MAG: toll/interleukin-1 receptor domain-containing protein [Pirellulaceae bacterium]
MSESDLSGLLERAGNVFTLAGELGRAFHEEGKSRTILYDPSIWERHAPVFEEFWRSLLQMRVVMQDPPSGFEPVAVQLKQAARIARRIRRTIRPQQEGDNWNGAPMGMAFGVRNPGPPSFTDYWEFFPDLNSVSQAGWEAIKGAAKAKRLDDLPSDLADQLTNVLHRELTIGTVEQIEEVLRPAVRAARDHIEKWRDTAASSARHMEALKTAKDELEQWNGLNSPSESGYFVEPVSEGHPAHTAVAALQAFYGGALPRPAIDHWRRFLRHSRNDEEDAEGEAARLVQWIDEELARLARETAYIVDDSRSITAPSHHGKESPLAAHQKRFRIALSFPGEYREFVAKVAEHLSAAVDRARVLYDKYYEADFARPDLDTYLQRLYHDESELIAVFLCADYERKEWCGLEWRAILDLIKRRQTDSVMLLRFDNTEIPGLFSTDGYVWIGDRSPDDIAQLILQRIGFCDSSPDEHRPPPKTLTEFGTNSDDEILEVLKRLPAAQFEELVYRFDKGNAIPGRHAPQADRAVELLRLVRSQTEGLQRLHTEIRRLREVETIPGNDHDASLETRWRRSLKRVQEDFQEAAKRHPVFPCVIWHHDQCPSTRDFPPLPDVSAVVCGDFHNPPLGSLEVRIGGQRFANLSCRHGDRDERTSVSEGVAKR